jgi:hypothetical protein
MRCATVNRLIAILALWPCMGLAFEDQYSCTLSGSTYLGWNSAKKEYHAKADVSPDKQESVKLGDINTEVPVLGGNQGVTKLTKLNELKSTLSMSEITTGGTLVVWTLFEKAEGRIPKTLLIMSKTYEVLVAGPHNITTLYECE